MFTVGQNAGIPSLTQCVFLAILLLTSPCAFSADTPTKTEIGPDFCIPSDLASMPEDWIKQPVVYQPSDQGADLVVTLDQEIYHRQFELVKEFADKSNKKVVTHEGTCGISAGMVMRKQADISGFCCPPDKTDRLPGVRFHTLGIAPLSFLVHPALPVDDLPEAELRRIFRGEVFKWSEVRTPDKRTLPDIPIQVVGRLHCKQRPGHWRLFLDNSDLFSPRMLEVGTIPDMIRQVAITPGAIGFETLWHVERFHDQGQVKILSVNGHSPLEDQQLLDGKYPAYGVFNITSWISPHDKPLGAELVEFLKTETKRLTGKYGWVHHSRLRERGWIFAGDELVGRFPQDPPKP